MKRHTYKRQKGMVLVIALIMLTLMMLMTVASFNLGRNSLDILGNMQQRDEVVNAANSAIQETLSTVRLFENPGAIFLNPCAGSNTRCFDTNGDGINDVTVSLTPQPACIQSRSILASELDFTSTEDLGCTFNIVQDFGRAGAGQATLCADSLWEIKAVATDNLTGSSITITEGAAVRVASDDVATSCPTP